VPFVPAAAPVALRVTAPVAAVTIDAPRRRVFALGARSLAVIDADTGTLLATIRIGGARSVALEPLGGHVFVGTGDGHISEIDPDRKAIVRTTDAGSQVDLLVYDAVTGRLYLDGGDASAIAVFDARTFKRSGSISFGAGRPGSIATDPVTREMYVAESDSSIAVVDPGNGSVRSSFPTPGLPGNSVVRFDDTLGQIAVVGANGTLAVYDRAGTERARVAVPPGLVACDIDTGSHVLVCTGPADVTFVQLAREATPVVTATVALKGSGFAAVDAKTSNVVLVDANSGASGMNFERFHAVNGR
jgi:DNA-binding beta-propeller fold protein YncE